MEKQYGFFDILTSIVNKKEIPDEIIKKQFNSFIALNWLSNHPAGLLIGNYLNASRGNSSINDFVGYKFLRNAINLPKNTFIKYSKKQKQEELLELIEKKYKCSYETAREYLEILPDSEIKKIKAIKKGIK